MKTPFTLRTLFGAGFALASPVCLMAQNDPEQSIGTSNQTVNVEVTNSTAAPLSVIWVNFNGLEENYGEVAVGASVDLQTYGGHLWRFKQSGRIVARFRATGEGRQAWQIGERSMPAPGPAPLPEMPVPAPAPDPSTPVQQSSNSSTGSLFTARQADQFLTYHNEKRAEVGVGPLQWSADLAREAQAWAEHIAETGQFEHRPRQGENATQHGENLAAGFGGGYTVLSAAADWYDEKKLYPPGSPVTQGSYQQTGHYTQMVWRGTTLLGAGTAIGKSGQLRGWIIVVCNYDPAGNFLGQKPY